MIPKKRFVGFTLIELLIAIAISSIIGLGLVSLQYILGQNQVAITQNYRSVDDANFAVTTFTKEIRRAGQSEIGSYLLATANDFEIVFYSDSDLDGRNDRISYRLEGTNLIRSIISPTTYPVSYPIGSEVETVLSDIVRNAGTPVFYYYNEDYPTDVTNNPLVQSARLADTRTVRIYLRVNTEANDFENDFIMDSFTNIRMLKDNI